MTGYTWTVSGGGAITAGGGLANNSVTVTWNTAGSQSVQVSYTDPGNCNATSLTTKSITVNSATPPPPPPPPTPPAPVVTLTGAAGTDQVCSGSTGNVYTTEAQQYNYVWRVSEGGTITSGGGSTDNSVTVTWNTAGLQSVSVNYTNTYGGTAAKATVKDVLVNAAPVPTLSGPVKICSGAAGNYYVTESGMSGYTWIVSSGGTISSGGGSTDNSVTVTWNSTGEGQVSVNYTNGSGCTAVTATVRDITVNALPVPTISGATTVCAGSQGNVYSTESGMSGYQWSVSPGGTITSGGGAADRSVTVTWNTAEHRA